MNKAEEEMYSVKTLESKVAYTGMLDDIMEALFERSPGKNATQKMYPELVVRLQRPWVFLKKLLKELRI